MKFARRMSATMAVRVHRRRGGMEVSVGSGVGSRVSIWGSICFAAPESFPRGMDDILLV